MASDEANLGVIFKLDFLFVAVRTSVEITALLSVKSYSGPLAARPYDYALPDSLVRPKTRYI